MHIVSKFRLKLNKLGKYNLCKLYKFEIFLLVFEDVNLFDFKL